MPELWWVVGLYVGCKAGRRRRQTREVVEEERTRMVAGILVMVMGGCTRRKRTH